MELVIDCWIILPAEFRMWIEVAADGIGDGLTCGCTSDTAQCISLRSCIGTRTAARRCKYFHRIIFVSIGERLQIQIHCKYKCKYKYKPRKTSPCSLPRLTYLDSRSSRRTFSPSGWTDRPSVRPLCTRGPDFWARWSSLRWKSLSCAVQSSLLLFTSSCCCR